MSGGLAVALDPRSVAVIGASEDPDKIGGRPLFFLRRHGFAGAVYPVNPRREVVQELRSYPDLAALPEVPDVVIVAVAGAHAVRAVEDCAAAGVKVAVVLASGFGEVSEEGRAEERRMVATARAAGMRIVGPNAYGLGNLATGAMLTFSTALRDGPVLEGPVAVVSQSGSMSVVPYLLLRQQGIGIRGVYGTGNDADVSVAELAVEVARDPGVELLLLYLETVRDAAPLAELARVARERDLPVIALKGGRTPAGQVAARSHTGALANEDRVVDAFLEAHGIWRARDVDDLVRAAALHLKGWQPAGRRTVVISNSGASCVQAADAAFDHGLPLDPLTEGTRHGLAEVLPGFATTTNPVDITAALLSDSTLFSKVLPLVADDPSGDAFLVAIPVAGPGYDVATFATDTGRFARATGKPVVMAVPDPSVAEPFRAQGLPVFASEASAVAALAQYLDHDELRRAARARAQVFVRHERTGPTELLHEAAGLELAAAHGVPVVEHRLCRDADEAVAALAELGGPVVVKGCSALAPHKTELGLVRVGLSGEAAVRQAADEIGARLREVDPAAPGLLVARMAGGHELLLGAHVDPVLGPVVLVGAGGTEVEVLPDVRVLLPPFTAADVRAAIGRLRVAPLLAGTRGRPAADVDAFADAAVAVGRLALDDRAAVTSIDLNPVFVGPVGQGCVAADAVVERLGAEG